MIGFDYILTIVMNEVNRFDYGELPLPGLVSSVVKTSFMSTSYGGRIFDVCMKFLGCVIGSSV
jgi:hypothetical protein